MTVTCNMNQMNYVFLHKNVITSTVNPLYTDIRHNDIIRYKRNLTGTKVTGGQKLCKKIEFNTSRSINFENLLESPQAILTNIQNICFIRKQE